MTAIVCSATVGNQALVTLLPAAVGRTTAEAGVPSPDRGWDVRLDGWVCARGTTSVSTEGGMAALCHALAGPGTDGLADLVGEYAFVAWNRARGRLVAARDPMASRPLFWTWDGRRLVVASRVPDLLARLCGRRRPDEGAVAELICERPSTTTATVWSDVQRLPGGHALVLDATTSSLRTRRFWRPEPGPEIEAPDELLRDVVERAVRRRAPDGEPVACELSGGFDSSTVLGTAVALGLGPRAYSTVHPGEACDETELIRASLAYHGIDGRLLAVTPPSLEQRRQCVRAHGLIGDYVLGVEEPARAAAADGHGAILTGDFGDEVLAGIGLADADGLDRHRWAAVRRLVAGPRRRQLAALAYRDRLRWRLGRAARRRWQDPLPYWVPPALARRVDLVDRFSTAEAAPVSGPPSFRTLMATFDGWWTQSRSDLGEVDFAPRARQRTPLADLELVELSLRIPQGVKGAATDRRRLHRSAFEKVLAPAIRSRTGKAEFSSVTHVHLQAGPDLLEGRPAIVELGWVTPDGLHRLRHEVLAARPALAFTRNLWAYATLNELELWAREWVV